jgi:hypothetical protein
MCIYVTFSGLLIKKDQIPTIEAKGYDISGHYETCTACCIAFNKIYFQLYLCHYTF